MNVELGRFHCFVCGISEDLIGLIMLREGVTFAEAKQKAEEDSRAGNAAIPGESFYSDLLPIRPGNHRGNSGRAPAWRRHLP